MKDNEVIDDFVDKVYARYASKRPESEQLFEEAQRFLPGGDTRSLQTHRPFPTYMERAEGCQLYDVDGNSYIDFLNNGSTLPIGHRHPKVLEAVNEQLRKGSVFGCPVESQVKLAREICNRLRSAESVRFTNSGTEATMLAIRLVRAYTKKHKIAKVEGTYLGSHDLGVISVTPPLKEAGPVERPVSVPGGPGIPPSVLDECIILPANRNDIAKQIIEENHEELAGVFVEPFVASSSMALLDPDYVKTLSRTASHYGIPLVFDEVVSFRLAEGGCQEILGVVPDLTALGKLIGGGTPAGAIAGRKDIMDLFNPFNQTHIRHSGSYNGNPLSMVAGLATLEVLTGSEINRINQLGDLLRSNFRKIFEEVGIHAQVVGMGSLSTVHFTNQEIKDCRSLETARSEFKPILHLLLMDKGIYASSAIAFFMCTPMREQEVIEVGAALKSSLIEMRPYIEKIAQNLIF
jgi:glutamate-1-semialdehyde 2,1-aminomutase